MVLLVVGVLIVPQITFAAWWNPFSWNWKGLFNTPAQEQQSVSLEVSNIATTTQKIATSTSVSTPKIKVNDTTPKPSSGDEALVQARIQAQVQAGIKAKADQDALIAKQKADEQAKIDAQSATSASAQEVVINGQSIINRAVEQSGWLTYTNEKYSVQYPKEYKVKNFTFAESLNGDRTEFSSENSGIVDTKIEIYAKNIARLYNVNTHDIPDLGSWLSSHGTSVLNPSYDAVVSGRKTIHIIYDNNISKIDEYYFVNGDWLYIIAFRYEGGMVSDVVREKILSSFSLL